MLNKAIKELMSESGLKQKNLAVAMGQLESTFSRMFTNDDSDPKSSSIELLARRLNIKVSDIYLRAESLAPVMCRFFYSPTQWQIKRDDMAEDIGEEISKSYVYINGLWHQFSEKKSNLESSNFKDVVYLGEAQRWHTKRDGKVHCPDLYKKLCDEMKELQK